MEARPINAPVLTRGLSQVLSQVPTEVLIVGGGPAGAAAAIACAQGGLRTRLMEREAETVSMQDKPGEGLHPGVASILGELGVTDRLIEVTRARFPGVWVGWNQAPRFEAFGADGNGPWLGYQVCRRSFDAMLRQHARDCGAEILCGQPLLDPLVEAGAVVGARTAQASIRCRLLIDCSGPARWLARKLPLPDRSASPPLAVRYGYVRGAAPARDHAPALVSDRTGWTWTARVGDGLYQWARLDFDRKQSRRGWLPAEFSRLARAGASRGADATWRVAPAAGPGWLLAGDAAANLDPTSSKGVLKALLSGVMAGRTTVAILRRGAPATRGALAYRRWLEGWFDDEVAALAGMYGRLGVRGFG